MSAGMMLLIIAAVLVFCGLLQRVLDRMYLTDRQALFLIAAMIAGTFLPEISLRILRINIGGAVIPLGVCIYLFVKADENVERWRALLGAVLTASAVYALSVLLPSEPEALLIEPMWLYGLCGGIIAWVLGRSRRNSFICGVAGVILADIISGVVALMQGYQVQIVLGGGGIADAAIISGVMGVLLCEIIGECIERIARMREHGGRA